MIPDGIIPVVLPRVFAMAVEFPAFSGHPNRVPFEGCLSVFDEPSDKPPSGACGHRIVLAGDAVKEVLPSLLGMGVNFKSGWSGHDVRQKCGLITSARLEERQIIVAGFIYAADFPEVEEQASKRELGMSYELKDATISDMREGIWKVSRFIFTGAAILLREEAAYKKSWFKIAKQEGAR